MNWRFILFNATFSAIVVLTFRTITENFTVPMSTIVGVPIYTFILSFLLEKIKFELVEKENKKRD